MTQAEKQEIIKAYATHEGDTGSPEVQVAVLTTRINELTEHLKTHKKDHQVLGQLVNTSGQQTTEHFCRLPFLSKAKSYLPRRFY